MGYNFITKFPLRWYSKKGCLCKDTPLNVIGISRPSEETLIYSLLRAAGGIDVQTCCCGSEVLGYFIKLDSEVAVPRVICFGIRPRCTLANY